MKTKPFLCLPLVLLSAAFALAVVLFLFGCAPQAGVAADADLSREQRGGQAGAATIRYVAPAPEGKDEGDCSNPSSPCASVQYAVDQANAGDEVRIAGGTYTQVSHRPPPPGYAGEVAVITQCVYLSKSLTLRGGYTPSVDGGQGGWTVSDPAANPTVLDAQGQGRVLFIAGEISPTIEGLRLTGGNASGLGGFAGLNAGGGVYIITATATLSSNEVISNTGGAPIEGWGSLGGGVFLFRSPSQLIHNTISANIAVASNGASTGGGIYIFESAAELIGNVFEDNHGDGGAVLVENSPALLMDNQIRGNFAIGGFGGGGVYLLNSDAMLLRNVIADNRATNPGYDELYGGGGIYILGGSPQLIGNLISGNQYGTDACWGNGGGVYIGSGSRATFTNNVFLGNCASWGAQVYISYDSSPTFLHNTFTKAGPGITVFFNSQATLVNSIIVGQDIGLQVGDDSIATLNGVLWFDNQSNISGGGVVTVTSEYTGDPAFAEDGYHLTAASAAIDRGVNAGVETDLDGLPRLVGAAPDLGAHEYPVAVRPNLLFFPMTYKQEWLPGSLLLYPETH